VPKIYDDVRCILRGCSRLAKSDRIVDADEVSRGVRYHRGTDGVRAIGNSHEGWSSAVEIRWDVAHGLLGAVAVADDGSDEGDWTSGGRRRCREDEGVGGERRPHHSCGKRCDGGWQPHISTKKSYEYYDVTVERAMWLCENRNDIEV